MKTLRDTPDQFGLYNNGNPIVVTNLQELSTTSNGSKVIELIDPCIVNGCQTTQMIRTACEEHFNSGGTGPSPAFDEWAKKAEKGVVITKVVKVGDSGGELLQNIARYTNRQNAIRDQDFVALEDDFQRWALEMKDKYKVYMETQRGEWEAQQYRQKQNPKKPSYKEHAYAFDLIKVYGAGWFSQPGLAFGDNAPFIPPSTGAESNGVVYQEIIKQNKVQGQNFGANDLFAAYCLKKAADDLGFGRKGDGSKPSRAQTRYMFYMVVIDLLKDILSEPTYPLSSITYKAQTVALLQLFEPEHKASVKILLDVSVRIIDEYLSQENPASIFKEPKYGEYHDDLGSYLKWHKLGGKPEDMEKQNPNLYRMLSDYKRMLRIQQYESQTSLREVIVQSIALPDSVK